MTMPSTQPSDPLAAERERLEENDDMVKRLGRVGSFAPGNYMCKCIGCGVMFSGDKRALHCLPCAISSALSTTPPMAAERENERREEIAAISEALGLFPSVIKSGEVWTATCQSVLTKAREALDRLALPPLPQQGEWTVPKRPTGKTEDGFTLPPPIFQQGVPIPMVLHCPACGLQHIDEATKDWDNPPHRSHLCHGCGHIWRPADIATTGVQAVQTKGSADSPVVSPAEAQARVERAFHAGYAIGGQDALDGKHRANAAWMEQEAALLSGSTPKSAGVEIDDAMIERALKARVPGGAEVWDWLPKTHSLEPHDTAKLVVRAALTAALSGGSDAKAD